MEVTLRKTKITASILKQMMHANRQEILTFEVIGYFNTFTKGKPVRKALLTDGKDYRLCFLYTRFFDYPNYDLKVVYESYFETVYRDLTLPTNIQLRERLMEVKQKAIKAGQIFY